MENQLTALDSSILIDYFRKKNKEKSAFVRLAKSRRSFAVSVITRFEFLVGGPERHRPFWDRFFNDFRILPLTSHCIDTALTIHQNLRQRNKQIAFPDLLIAATAIANGLPLATLNTKHFNRIGELELYEMPK